MDRRHLHQWTVRASEWAHILIQDNCAWWNYISHWHTGMAHPAKQKPTGGPDGQPMTANIQLSVRGRWKYRGCSVQEPYLRCLSVSEASAGRQLWQIIRLPLGPDSTHTFTHTNTRVHRPTRRFKKKKSLNLTTDRCVFRLHVIILCGMQPRWWQSSGLCEQESNTLPVQIDPARPDIVPWHWMGGRTNSKIYIYFFTRIIRRTIAIEECDYMIELRPSFMGMSGLWGHPRL